MIETKCVARSDKLHPLATQLSEQNLQQASNLVQMSCALVSNSDKSGVMDMLYTASMTVLGALLPTSMMLANKPDVDEKEFKERHEEITKAMMNNDTLLFAALVVAHMPTMSKEAMSVEFSPRVFKAALADWEKLTGKKPDGIFHPKMLESAREAADLPSPGVEDPFDKFMKQRASEKGNVLPFPESKTLN